MKTQANCPVWDEGAGGVRHQHATLPTPAGFTALSHQLMHQVAAENPPSAGDSWARHPQPRPQQGAEARTSAAKPLEAKSIIAAAESAHAGG